MPGTALLNNYTLNHLFGKDTLPSITNLYAGLAYVSPNKAGAYTSEVVGTNYNRLTLSPLMSAASVLGSDNTQAAIPNATDVLFGIASNNWGTIGYLFCADTITKYTGKMYLYASFDAPVNIALGERLQVNASNLVFTCD